MKKEATTLVVMLSKELDRLNRASLFVERKRTAKALLNCEIHKSCKVLENLGVA